MLSETRERFARAIAVQVPPESIVEIHFFQPIRQGGVESGVAVIAVEMKPIEGAAEPSTPTLEGEDANAVSPTEAVGPGAESEADAATEPAVVMDPEAATEPAVVMDSEAATEPTVVMDPEAATEPAVVMDSEAATEPAVVMDPEAATEPTVVMDPEGSAPNDSAAARRYTVYTARYRLTLKGLDRGKWETTVVAEADAPLPTIDTVVRGVLRRAGDVEDAERMTGEEVMRALSVEGLRA